MITQHKKYIVAISVIAGLTLVGLFIFLLVQKGGTFSKTGDGGIGNRVISGSISPKNVPEYFDGIDIAMKSKDHDDILGKDMIPVIQDYRAGNYDGAISKQEALIKTEQQTGATTESKEVQKVLTIGNKLFLANLYLEKADSDNQAKTYAPKAIQTVSALTEEDYGAYGMYFVGYAYEITKEYDKALLWYNKGLKISSNTDKLRAIFKNQIGHVYEFLGDTTKAYAQYNEAYALDKTNYAIATNMGRYLAQIGQFEDSMKFFEYATQTPNTRLRSELYYSMSSISLAMNGFKPDIDQSITYAEKSIESSPTYAMGYVALARGLYMKNDSSNYQKITENLDKALKIYPSNYSAYELLALNQYDQGKLKESIDLLDKSLYAIKDDKNLIENERKSRSNRINYEKFLFLITATGRENKSGDFTKDVHNFASLPDGKDLIRLQLKRIDYGYLGSFKNEKSFNELLTLYK